MPVAVQFAAVYVQLSQPNQSGHDVMFTHHTPRRITPRHVTSHHTTAVRLLCSAGARPAEPRLGQLKSAPAQASTRNVLENSTEKCQFS